MLSKAVAELRAKHQPADPDGVVARVSHGGAIRLGAEWLSDNMRPELADQDLSRTPASSCRRGFRRPAGPA